jgi:hypothetical protein
MTMKRIVIIAALLLVGAGCGAKSTPAPAPAPTTPEAPTAVGLPRTLKEPFDEDDHLDAALQELDLIE